MKVNIDPSEAYYLHNSIIEPCSDFSGDIPDECKVFYEVIRVINNTPLFFKEHIERLYQSVKKSELNCIDTQQIENSIQILLIKNPVKEKNLKISFWCKKDSPQLLAYFVESNYPTEHNYNDGIGVELLPMERANPNVKIENPLLRHSADKIICISQTREALLVNEQGFITEGSRSNFFAVIGNSLITPPSNSVLRGITREVVIELASKNGILCTERTIHISEIERMDGAFITGTSTKVLPIKRIGNYSFRSIPMTTRKIMELYDQLVFKLTS